MTDHAPIIPNGNCGYVKTWKADHTKIQQKLLIIDPGYLNYNDVIH